MAVNTMPQKRYDYYINGTKLTTDPKGWDEHSIGFTRSEDFGLNVEVVVPLSFSGNGRDILKSIYESDSVFSNATLSIYKRGNDWQMEDFYTYRLDFSTYKDNLKFIEISGVEVGLLSKFKANKDTEYEIDLPVSPQIVKYSGMFSEVKNVVQVNYGDISSAGVIFDLLGDRAVRTYTDFFSFTDLKGLPYKTATARALQTGTFKVKIKINLTIECNGYFFAPDSGKIGIVKKNAGFNYILPPVSYITPSSTSIKNGTRRDVFTGNEVEYEISINEGETINLAYFADNSGSYRIVRCIDSFDSYMSFATIEQSALNDTEIKVFSYDWILNEIIKKIDPTATFSNSLILSPDYDVRLTCTQCFTGGKIKVKISDILKSLSCIKPIGIDISGDIFSIKPIEEFYKNESAGRVKCKNISVNHDISHQFKKISIGTKIDKLDDADGITKYPYLCKYIYDVEKSELDSELDLTNPFFSDPYQFEVWYKNIIGDTSKKENTDFFILAVENSIANAEWRASLGYNSTQSFEEGYFALTSGVGFGGLHPAYPISFDSKISDGVSGTNRGLFAITSTKSGSVKGSITIRMQGTDLASCTIDTNFDTYNYNYFSEKKTIVTGTQIVYYVEFEVNFITGVSESFRPQIWINHPSSSPMNFQVMSANISIERNLQLYKNIESISGFYVGAGYNGYEQSLFNMPFTGRRLIENHIKYISVSNYKSGGNIIRESSEYPCNFTSKLYIEDASVSENSAVESSTPIFLPATIECETVSIYNPSFEENKYKYIQIEDEKTGKIYEGWINSITFAPTRNKSQKLILQAKKI